MCTMQDESPAVFCDDFDVDPALAVDQLGSANVVHISIAVCLVLLAVVVEADFRLVITHVDECFVDAVANANLGARRRKPVVNEIRRTRVSCGDSAPSSISGRATLDRGNPRALGYLSPNN
jgi:hypothetical protein